MFRAETFLATAFRQFLQVAEAGSVRAAARLSNTAASAISRQVALLESQLGIPLFDRVGRNLRLTPAGEALKTGLLASSEVHEQTLDALNALRGLQSGRLRIATVESLSMSVLPDVLASFLEQYPGVQVSVFVAGSDAVTELVNNYAADLGFTFNPASVEGLEVLHAYDLPMGAVLHPGHPLAQRKSLTFAECLAYPLAWPARGLSLRALLDPLVQDRPDFRPQFECDSLRVMAALARRGRCIAFQPSIGIEQEIAAGTVVHVPLSDRRLGTDRLVVIRRQGQAARLAADTFLQMAKGALPGGRTVRKK
ncbi:MAG: LysR family transcriptional regulator [Proteobacteria bacterium]|nr:LysR family transcriptional regulator [Pseudomonadota bacterium]